MSAAHPLVESWNIVSRITLYVLEGIQPEALADRLTPRAWCVGQHFAHLHANRMNWMEGYKDLLDGLQKIPADQAVDKALLKISLEQSAQRVATMIERGITAGKIKNFKRHPEAFVGYLIAHESYHHGEIGVILAQCGHRLDNEIAWGMWEWEKR